MAQSTCCCSPGMKVAVAKIIPAGLRYSLVMHESMMYERELSSSLSDRHGMADCGLDAHATHTWSMRNGAFEQSWGWLSNARREEPDKLVVPRRTYLNRAELILVLIFRDVFPPLSNILMLLTYCLAFPIPIWHGLSLRAIV